MGKRALDRVSRLLFDDWPFPVLATDPAGELICCNAEAARFLKTTAADLQGKGLMVKPLRPEDGLQSPGPFCLVWEDGTRSVFRGVRKDFGDDSGLCRLILVTEDKPLAAPPEGDTLLYRVEEPGSPELGDADLLKALLEAIPDNIYFKDRQSRFIRASKALVQWFGINSPEEMIGKTDFDFFTGEHAEDAFHDEQDVLKSGKALVDKEEKETWPNGHTTWVSSTKVPLRSGAGEVVGTLGISRDITARKLADQALREKEELFRSLVHNASEIISIMAPDSTFRYLSASVTALLGFDPDQLAGSRMLDLIHPEDQGAAQQAMDKVLEKERATLTSVIRWRHCDGAWRTFETTYSNLLENPAVAGIVGNSRDITEFLRVEEKLQQSNKLLETIFSTIHVKIALMDAEFNFIRVNRAYAEADCRDPEFFVGKNHFDLYPSEENQGIFRRVVETGEPFFVFNKPFVYHYRPERGTTYWDWSLEPVWGAGREVTGLVLSLVDVTDRTRAVQELEQSREDLRRFSTRLEAALEDERKAIAYELHDELGQTLTALKIELAAMSNRLMSEHSLLHQKTNSMADLVASTLERVRRISRELRPAILDNLGLEAAIDWQATEFQRYAGITCKFTSNMGECPLDPAASTALFRILQEALTNVARHAEAKRVKIELHRDAEFLTLKVVDDGKGIDESRVFKTDSLGLLGIRERATRLNGEVTIRALPRRGTSVCVRIPFSCATC
jgi:PAS domain S-box-containing protein